MPDDIKNIKNFVFKFIIFRPLKSTGYPTANNIIQILFYILNNCGANCMMYFCFYVCMYMYIIIF